MDITKLSDEELLKLAGGGASESVSAPDITQLSDKDLLALAGSTGEASVKTMGAAYFKEHPFKSIFEPITKTMGGKTFNEMALEKPANVDAFVGKSRPFDSKLGLVKPVVGSETFIKGAAGSAADIATTPGTYIPVPGKFLGKIPVGSTNVGRVASNVAVGKGFGQGVKELQRMETKLQDIGKLSSPGVKIGTEYNPAVNQSIIQAHNYINTPPASKFKQVGQITARDNKIAQGYKVLSDFVGDTTPKSIDEALTAANQVEGDIYKTYTSQAKGASAEGATVDLAAIAKKELQPLVGTVKKGVRTGGNPQILTHRKGIIKPIEDYITDFTKRGKVPIDEAQKDLEVLNVDIGKYLRSGSVDEQNIGAIKLSISQAIRKQADESIQTVLGKGGYQELRNKYGAVKTVRDELLRAYAKNVKPNKGISHPILDVASGMDLGQALLHTVTGQPQLALMDAGKALISQGVKKGIDIVKSPDSRIAKIFKELAKAKITPQEKGFILPNRGSSQPSPLLKPNAGQGEADMAAVGDLYAQPAVTKRPVTNQQRFEAYKERDPLLADAWQRRAKGGIMGDESGQVGGKPIYHGTDKIFKNFDVKKSADGTIWFTDNKSKIVNGEVAASGKGRIIQRFIDENKLKLAGWEESDKYGVDELMSMGYDGVKLPGKDETTYQIFHPNKLQKGNDALGILGPTAAAGVGTAALLRSSKAQAAIDQNKNVNMGIDKNFRIKVEQLNDKLKKQGVQVRVVSAFRSPEEQKKIYAQGRTTPGKVVTNTLKSKHTEGKAVDVVVIKNGKVSYDPKDYKQLGDVARALGLTWGGDFKMRDYGHIQYEGEKPQKMALKAKAKK